MSMNREKTVFLVTVLLVAWLGWSELSTDRATMKGRRPRGRALAVDTEGLDVLEPALLGENEATWDQGGRNIFRAPSELEPLPPLTLPVPPRSPLPLERPTTVPGPDPYHRFDLLTVPVVHEGVRLPPREEPGFLAAITEGEEEDENVTSAEPEDAGQGETEPKKPLTRAERKVMSLRMRLQKKTEERIEEAKEIEDKARQLAERQRTLDKIHWLSGEVWYGRMENDARRKPGQGGFDKYEIKLRIDTVRNDASMAPSQKEQALSDRDLEIVFRRFDSKKFRFEDALQKLSPVNIASIEFAESPINVFELRFRQTPKDALADQLGLGQDLAAAGEYRRAKQHFLMLLEGGAKSKALFLALADTARRDFDLENETRALREGLKLGPDDAELLAAQADLHHRLGLNDLALASLEKAIKLAPQSPRVNAALGRVLLAQGPGAAGGTERAAEHLRKALLGRYADRSERRRVQRDLATAEFRLRRLAEAKRLYETILGEVPNDTSTLVGLGSIALAEKDLAGAKASYQSALKVDPWCGGAYLGLGLVALDEKDWVTARDSFLDAAEADPLLSGRALIALGFLYELIGDTEAATNAYASAYEADPSDPEVILFHGRGYLLNGDAQSAGEQFARAAEKLPGQFDLLAHLSESAFLLGRFSDALRYLDAAIALSPKTPALLVRRAQTLARMRRNDEAKAALEAAKVVADDDEVELSLAWYYYSQGNAEEALKRLKSIERELDRRDETPRAQYVRTWARAIEENLSMRVWKDHFDRVASGRDLLRGWKVHAPGSGISISLLQNSVRFQGTQRESETPSAIIQERPGRALVSFEAALTARAKAPFVSGVAILSFRGKPGDENPFTDPVGGGMAYEGLVFARLPEGRLAYRLIERHQMSRWHVLGSSWPAGAEGAPGIATLGIRVEDPKKGIFRLVFDGQDVGPQVEVKGLSRSARELQGWVFAQAEIDRKVDLHVDDVRIVTRIRKGR